MPTIFLNDSDILANLQKLAEKYVEIEASENIEYKDRIWLYNI